MLSFVDSSRRSPRERRSTLLNRRAFLQIGSLGAAGLLPAPAAGFPTSVDSSVVRGKSVILLFLHGGPSQTETFDPKMTAPAGIRSATGEIATSIPGVTFGSTFQKLARRADQLAIVRSFKTGDGKHDIKPVVSSHSDSCNVGALFARMAGTNHPLTGMPTNAALFPRSVDESTQPRNMNFGKFVATGDLGSAYAPFVPGGIEGIGQDLKLALDKRRIADRRQLLGQLDRLRRDLDNQHLPGLERLREQAFQTILGGIADAFDLSKEAASVVEAYDTAPLVRPDQISRRWNNYHNYVDNAKALGKLLLLARRLCEAGCGFVTVTTNFVWDMHADKNNAGVEEGMQYMGSPLDHAVAALLDDLKSRGLDDQIQLVICGEMGRTPKINKNGGRDHWGNLAPLVLAGADVPQGTVWGQSSADAGSPATTPIEIPNLIATMMHTLLDIGKVRTLTGIPNQILQNVTEPSPIWS